VLAIVWLVLMAGVFYLLLWRPQQRRMSQVRSLQGHLQVGDDVLTTSGMFGTIIEPGTVVRVARGAIGERLTADSDADTADPDSD
jgi:preprotein translocase subunit YajC